MKLPQLIKSAALANATISGGIMQLGEILFHISCRFNREGLDLACDTLGLSKPLAGRLIAAYRGVLHPDIALGSVPFANKLEKLNITEQNEIMKNGIPYMERLGSKGSLRGKLKVVKIPVSQLDTAQVTQLFDGPKLRNEQEQTQYLKNQDESPTPRDLTKARVNTKAWEIKNNRLVVNKPLFFTKKDLQVIIKKLK